MATAAPHRPSVAPRYGSPADVARYAGLSLKTVRRLVAAGLLRAFKVGRRVVIPFAEVDRFLAERCAVIHRPELLEIPEASTVPAIAGQDLAQRQQEAINLLDAWEADGNELEQREAMGVLRRALGPDRAAAVRNLFP